MVDSRWFVLQVVAPVRATCSQALGLVLGLLPLARVKMAAKLLMHMAVRKEWEVRYSSLLAIQHLLAARAVSSVCVGVSGGVHGTTVFLLL